MQEQEATCIPCRARLLRIAMTAAAISFGFSFVVTLFIFKAPNFGRYIFFSLVCYLMSIRDLHFADFMGGTHGGTGKGKKGGDKKSFGDGSGFKARTPAEVRQPMDAAGDRPRKPKSVNLNVHVHIDKRV